MTFIAHQSHNLETEDARSEATSLDTLAPLDTICVQTRNSSYRIFLLDPKTGRVLIEGGHFGEPVDAWLYGSTAGGTFSFGSIEVGMRLEFWTNDKHISTSPVKSFHIETHALIEPISRN